MILQQYKEDKKPFPETAVSYSFVQAETYDRLGSQKSSEEGEIKDIEVPQTT